ncbi:patatin-like phospholipase family protein [Microtetraspora sp. NBRC 16547]|uniref:patatin-like phospholipase family protein n=1 Tax=Microtetraspora sp. NBRC 16547 TaxID=3030993 RepID=UPI0024A1B1F8|nr:patatin-like phospholipase family protein [Microtetraspora sp. NBRC 16547]GLX01060.1 patatin [Microtetraspora sp. NBRC 16547]
MDTTTRALVLGGGGVAGIAWETGVLAGLADAGVDVTGADRIVGTSAGSTVAAQITSGLTLDELLRRQIDPAAQAPEITSGVAITELMEQWVEIYTQTSDPAEARRKAGALALAASTVTEERRREVIAARLPVHEWPDRDLVIVAVDAYTGEPILFTPQSGVNLVDAVAASCAVPCVWPAVTIGDTRYMDGGMRSSNNADLAAGHDRVLVLSPLEDPELAGQVATLGTTVEVLHPDDASRAAIGPDPLDPEVRTPSAEAGYAQGRAAAATVAALWR